MDFQKFLEEICSDTNNTCLKLNESCDQLDIWYENIEAEIRTIVTFIQDIEAKKAELEKHYEKMKRVVYEQNKILKEKANETEKVNLEYKNVYNELMSLTKEYEKQKQIYADYQKQLELTPHDKGILTSARQKLELYKEITNVVWDYSVPVDVAATGYARNKNKSYVHAFEYERSKLTHKEIVDNMWTEVENSAEPWSDIIDMCFTENKENISTDQE